MILNNIYLSLNNTVLKLYSTTHFNHYSGKKFLVQGNWSNKDSKMELYNKGVVNFSDLENGKKYKVRFKESEEQKTNINWGKFASNDVIIFSMDEIIKIKEEIAADTLVIKIIIKNRTSMLRKYYQ